MTNTLEYAERIHRKSNGLRTLLKVKANESAYLSFVPACMFHQSLLLCFKYKMFIVYSSAYNTKIMFL